MSGDLGRGGRALAAAVVAAVAGMLLGLLSAPAQAHAATSELLVSGDGVTFSPSLSGGLFSDLDLLVPQESTTASLWVRNASPDAAQMRISIAQLQASSAALATSVTLTTLDTGSGASRTASLDALGACSVVLSSRPMTPGQTVRIDFAITMLDVGQQIAQSELGRIDLLVALRDGAAGAFPTSACDDVGVIVPSTPVTAPPSGGVGAGTATAAGGIRSGSLVITGADSAAAFTLAGGLLLVGIVLVLRRRRRDESEQA